MTARQAEWKRQQTALFPPTRVEDVFGSLPRPHRAFSVREMDEAVGEALARKFAAENTDLNTGTGADGSMSEK